ncbi:MAG: hypothetical protein ACTHOB_03040 [Ginsengibacter sp.]
MEKEFAWLITIALLMSNFPALKKAIVFIVAMLYNLFVEHGIEK